MGLSSSSTKSNSTVTPDAQYAPQINAAAGAVQSAYNTAAPVAQGVSTTLQGQLPGLTSNIGAGSASLGAANNYNQYVLGGNLLEGSPYLAQIMANTNQDVRNQVDGTFSAAGRTGSGAQSYALGKALAANDTNLQYTDFNNQLGRMDQAAAQAPALASAGLGSYLTAAQGAVGIPQSAADQFASSTGALTGRYVNTTGTTTQTQSLGAYLAQIAGNAAANASRGG
ncbi:MULTISPECIES: hypothetical protein [unclassified Sphingomonas]|uniref:hypothetical protein n=1 Tax=unclassified Sphingomonas TaxID=196159 RepID=UPI002269B260|nr:MULTISPECIES: hypothetical protein [unclassified Sphingomonas]